MIGSASRALRDGMAAALARDFDAAHQLLQRATTESPTDIHAWLWRAVASPTPADAISCLRRVLVFEPEHAEAQQALARLLSAQAAGLAAGGQQAEGIALGREAAGLAPDCDAVWIALAGIVEDPQERLDALRRAHEITPYSPQIRVTLRDALLHGGIAAAGTNADAARTLFREASTVDPSDPRVWQALARMASNASEALAAHRELFKLAPERPGIRAALKRALVADAESNAAAGSTGNAVDRWREAVSLDDQDPALWLGLAGATQDRDEAQRALAVLDRAGIDEPRVAALRARWQSDEMSTIAPSPFTLTPLPSPSPFAITPPPAPSPFQAAPIPVATPIPVSTPIPISAPSSEATPADDIFGTFTPPPMPRPSLAPFAARPAAPAPPAAPAAPPAQAPAAAAASGGKRTVMIVDDSPTVRKILSMTLERAGYGVLSAADGEAALESLQNEVPDLILLDISMPKLDGYEVCKRVKADARTAHVPVVMLSGKDAFFDKVKGRMAGATEYLTKPFATPAVLAAVGRMFEPETGAAHG